jgi:hypothetical protein
LKVAVLNLVRDSQSTYLRKATYNTFVNRDLQNFIHQEVNTALAMQQAQGGNK